MTSDSDGTGDGPVGDPNDGADDFVDGAASKDDIRDEFDEIIADAELSSSDDLREPVSVGAGVPAGSARAAARASAARSSVTAGKGHATRARDQGPKRGHIGQRIMRFLREVAAELRKVIWPTRNEMVTYSIVVIIFLIFMIAVTWAADFGFARLILSIFG